MAISVQIPGPLLALTGGRRTVQLSAEAATLQEVLDLLFVSYPGLRDRVLTEQGTVREHVNIFLGKEDVRYLDGLATQVSDNAEIMIVPAVSGGTPLRVATQRRPRYKPAIPKVYGVQEGSQNPIARIRPSISEGEGKRETEAGKYEYGPRTPEINVPILGSTLRK